MQQEDGKGEEGCKCNLHKTLLVTVLMYGIETYEGRRRDLEWGLYKWTTSEDCWVLGGWIES